MISAREAAYRSLIRCEKSGSYTNLEIDSKIKKYALEGVEKSLYTALVYGVTERKISLDYYLGLFCSSPFEKLDDEVRVICRIGAYQLLYMDKIPQSAAVNEAVECAHRNAPHGAHTLVNALLRELCRNIDNLPLPKDKTEKLSVEYSVPTEIIELWQEGYGEEITAEILKFANSKPPVTVHINTIKTTEADLCRQLDGKGI